MRKFQAIDLFCCAGGASQGLADAGFAVKGVDIEFQEEYPFDFFLENALDFPVEKFDFIWASPPCQAFTAYKRRAKHVKPRPNLIPAIREKLQKSGKLWVMENVVGAPLISPTVLCGSMFDLDVRRHRLFESNFPLPQLVCQHKKQTPRFAPATNRKNLRSTVEVGVWRIPLEVQQKAMGIDWMSLPKLSQAIPPAYSKWIGEQAMEHLR